jgi:hypothetical protein
MTHINTSAKDNACIDQLENTIKKSIEVIELKPPYTISFRKGRTAIILGLSAITLTALPVHILGAITSLVNRIEEDKDWLIKKFPEFFKPLFDFFAKHPWFIPLISIPAGLITIIGGGLAPALGKISEMEFNDNINKYKYITPHRSSEKNPNAVEITEIENRSWLYKATHSVKFDDNGMRK